MPYSRHFTVAIFQALLNLAGWLWDGLSRLWNHLPPSTQKEGPLDDDDIADMDSRAW